MLVEELERQCQDLAGMLVGLKVAELLFEVAQWHHRFGHGTMAAGAADLVEATPHELARKLRRRFRTDITSVSLTMPEMIVHWTSSSCR